MRVLALSVALSAIALTGGCSVLDRISMTSSAPTLNPSKIYLGTSRVSASARDIDRYACVSGPVMCDFRGVSYECRCPNPF